jgi:hypothetical protein
MASRSPSGVHWLRATWHPRGSISFVPFPGSYLPQGRSIHHPNQQVRLNPHLTHKLEENSTFDASTLNVPFLFCTHVLRSPEFLEGSQNITTWLQPSGLSLTLDTVFQTSRVPKSQTSEGSTLARGDVLDATTIQVGPEYSSATWTKQVISRDDTQQGREDTWPLQWVTHVTS